MTPLLSVSHLCTCFHTRHGVVRAVDDVSFALGSGETLGIVGESGCGKSVLNYSLMGLVPSPPGRIECGTAYFEGIDLIGSPLSVLRALRGRRMAMIFQDPMTALNPYLRIGDQLSETLRIRGGISRAAAYARAEEALTEVGLADAPARLRMYPHEFSGGMRQRVMIAMALMAHPALLIADEPTTALDVTVQAQILDLIKQRQQALGMAVILITHDLGVVADICDRVLVMYAGRIVESSDTHRLFAAPQHPYTRALMDSRPVLDAPEAELYAIPGQPPDLRTAFPGCPFANRCKMAEPDCWTTACVLKDIGENRSTACLRVQNGALSAF